MTEIIEIPCYGLGLVIFLSMTLGFLQGYYL